MYLGMEGWHDDRARAERNRRGCYNHFRKSRLLGPPGILFDDGVHWLESPSKHLFELVPDDGHS